MEGEKEKSEPGPSKNLGKGWDLEEGWATEGPMEVVAEPGPSKNLEKGWDQEEG